VLLDVRELAKDFPGPGGRPIRAVDRVSFSISPGEVVALVGESGSGKSTIGLLLTRLEPASGGSIRFDGTDLTKLGEHAMRRLRAAIQIVFQDPYGTLNPRATIGRAIAEPLKLHCDLDETARTREVETLAERVRLPRATLSRFPHELSGGQLQRVAIARAIATSPRLLILDEPTSSLDLTVRAGILGLLDELRRETGIAMLFISHDLDTVATISERMLVLHLGRIVEQGATAAIFASPAHPYTQTLLSAHLPPDPQARLRRIALHGEPPSPLDPPRGCSFVSRCPLVMASCGEAVPRLEDAGNDRLVRCLRIKDSTHRISETTS
jgi:oligopeptide/dipeptide ABC transporter ATP-binding protein